MEKLQLHWLLDHVWKTSPWLPEERTADVDAWKETWEGLEDEMYTWGTHTFIFPFGLCSVLLHRSCDHLLIKGQALWNWLLEGLSNQLHYSLQDYEQINTFAIKAQRAMPTTEEKFLPMFKMCRGGRNEPGHSGPPLPHPWLWYSWLITEVLLGGDTMTGFGDHYMVGEATPAHLLGEHKPSDGCLWESNSYKHLCDISGFLVFSALIMMTQIIQAKDHACWFSS